MPTPHRVAKQLASGDTRYHYYAWRGGPRFYSGPERHELGAYPDWLQSKLDAKLSEAKPDIDGPPLGDFHRLAREYMASRRFRVTISNEHRTSQRAAITKAVERFGTLSIKQMNQPRFRKSLRIWRDKMADTPRAADLHISAVSCVLAQPVKDGDLVSNAAGFIDSLYRRPNDKMPIPPQDVEAYLNGATELQRNALMLAVYTGLRRKDLATITWSADQGDRIVWSTSKRSRTVYVPIVPDARVLLDELKANRGNCVTILRGEDGRPVSPSWAGRTVNNRFKALGMGHTLHRARNTFATVLKSAEIKNETIAMIMGWTVDDVEDMMRIYVDMEQIISAAAAKIGRV